MPTRRTGGSSKAGQVGRTGLGRAIESDRRRRADIFAPLTRAEKCGVAEGQAARSVLEQSSLDDFLAQAALTSATFEAERGTRFVPEGPRLVAAARAGDNEALGEAARRLVVPIPWRPAWQEASGAEELARLEGEAFLEWRRSLARVEEEHHVVMTPYERNIDWWRQLWRCVEKSDLIVQIVDGRDPEFYRSRDLERYVQTRFNSKRMLLVMNKSDFLPAELRSRWAAHWASQGVDVVFFSALRELHRQHAMPSAGNGAAAAAATTAEVGDGVGGTDEAAGKVEVEGAGDGGEGCDGAEGADAGEGRDRVAAACPFASAPHGDFEDADAADVLDCAQLLDELRARLPPLASDEHGAKRRGVVGFVGYPNVGKSSVINALFGAKKVSMSRTPGKTKQVQTLELPGADLTLCDCPGLVFPSAVATKAHLAINGTVPLTELRDAVGPVQVIVDKMGFDKLAQKYGLGDEVLREAARRLGDERAAAEDPARRLLAGLAVSLKHFLRAGVPDETWAARRVLRDFCSGELLHCEPPRTAPGAEAPAAGGRPGATVRPMVVGAPAGAEAAAPGRPAPVAGVAVAGAADVEEDSDFSDLDEFLSGQVREPVGGVHQKGRRQAAPVRRRRQGVAQ